MKETITWITDGSLPDSDITVLICDALDGEVDTGFHDGECWRWASASRVGGPIKGWADLPEGPKP